jgi:hypothetical protein
MVRKLSVKATIEMFSNENGFAWGIDTAMKALVPKQVMILLLLVIS